ncbi:hypothetical protein R1sor_021583 [Riccia sorocarpa]|uniref:Cytochrome P450 n=1 Tax=Riccia sorocarpa TaxID=122646 RepID=A0ABD3GJC7_9MARC
MASMWNQLSLMFSRGSDMILTVILALTVLWLLWSTVSRHFRNRSARGLPLPSGHFGLPFIGGTVEFLSALHTADGIRQWTQKQIKKHGPLFKWRCMGYSVVTMVQPEGNKFILQNESRLNHLNEMFHVPTLLGPESLLVQSGEQHKLSRRHLNRFFDHTAIGRYLDAMNRIAVRHFTNHWQGKERVVALDIINLYTFSAICSLMTLEEGPLMNEFMVKCCILEEGMTCLPINLPGFQYYQSLKARKWILGMLDRLMEQRRREIAEDRLSEAAKLDALTNLLTATHENGNALSDPYIKDNLLLLSIAGSGSTSSALALTLYYVAKNPHVYDEIIKEHKSILEGKRRSEKDDSTLTMEDISAMKYTWNVLKETLRLQPASPGTFRKTVADLEYKGYYIPKGWLLMWSNQDTHYNPEYFKDPLKFDPSRWEEPPSPFTYLPFGGGSHICLGNEYAKMEMLVFFHHLIRRYSWSLVDSNDDELIIRDPFPRTPNKTLIVMKQIIDF